MAFIDGTCLKCGRRYGWQGKIVDQPPCPKCGNEPDREALAKTQEQMDKAAELRVTPHVFQPFVGTSRFCTCGLKQDAEVHMK